MQPNERKSTRSNPVSTDPGADFHIQGEGCNFQVIAVGDAFEGLSPVKRQQLVYAALSDEIASGALHAISIKTFTPAQWSTASENAQ